MTDQEKAVDLYEKILEKIEDVRKDVRANFIKMLSIMLAACALILTGGGVSLTAMLNRTVANSEEIVKIRIEQGIDNERDKNIENAQKVEIVGLIKACGKKTYICQGR
jgi:cell division protein FtsX